MMTTPSEDRPAISYGHLEPVFVHFEDLDSMGLLHNIRYGLLVERALTMFWDRHGYSYRDGRLGHPDASVGVAEFTISYKTPVRGTGDVLVHLAVDRLGGTSVTYAFRLLARDGTVHAEGSRVQVRLDPQTHRPVPWAEETRTIYETLQRQ